MIVLSLFDGMSCGQIALERAGITVDKYYSSEIDKYAIKVTQKNYPDTIQLGDICGIQYEDGALFHHQNDDPMKNGGSFYADIDLIIGGSPCQGFSFAGKQLNFSDERSKLFFEFVRLLKEIKPKYFLLENVIMSKMSNDVISGILGEIYPECVKQGELFRTGRLDPILINSALVSAQNRRRLYWTNIPGVVQPDDKGIMLKDIIEDAYTERGKSYPIAAMYSSAGNVENYLNKSNRQPVKTNKLFNVNPSGHGMNGWVYDTNGKAPRVTTNKGEGNKILNSQTIKIGAFRGRNPENPTSCQLGLETKQRLELRSDYKSNCLTSVQKDNVVVKGFENFKTKNSILKIKKNMKNINEKANPLTSSSTNNPAGDGCTIISQDQVTWRKLTPIECERLQTVDDNYTNHVSNSRRYQMLGNGWTVDVVAHIFKGLK